MREDLSAWSEVPDRVDRDGNEAEEVRQERARSYLRAQADATGFAELEVQERQVRWNDPDDFVPNHKLKHDYTDVVPYWHEIRGRGPCHVINLELLRSNLSMLKEVADLSGCEILLAQKAFATHGVYGLIGQYLHGTCASSPNEVRLAAEKFSGDIHYYAPSFKQRDLAQIVDHVQHISFNSISHWTRWRQQVKKRNAKISCGLRINPGISYSHYEEYDPCVAGSRLGVTREELDHLADSFEEIEGLHVHALCQMGSEELERVMERVEADFSDVLQHVKWVNFGGGHLITGPEYDTGHLVKILRRFRKKYDVRVILEPGEAVVLNCGTLVTEVTDIMVSDGVQNAIVDASMVAHMPDVQEMKQAPAVVGTSEGGGFTYKLGGATCLSSDEFGTYSFAVPLRVGQPVVFRDMAHYTLVRTCPFNGLDIPSVATWEPSSGTFTMVREWGYESFRDSQS